MKEDALTGEPFFDDPYFHIGAFALAVGMILAGLALYRMFISHEDAVICGGAALGLFAVSGILAWWESR